MAKEAEHILYSTVKFTAAIPVSLQKKKKKNRMKKKQKTVAAQKSKQKATWPRHVLARPNSRLINNFQTIAFLNRPGFE